MLSAEQISIAIRGRHLLRNVSLTIQPGRFTAIVGPNGAGKSTFLKVLAGELRPTSGRISINGDEASSFSPRAMSLLRSVLPQDSQLQFAFSVGQVVSLGRQAHLATAKENAAVVDEVLELTGITSLKTRIYQTLSGGERQRVQLARVLAQVWEQTLFPRYLLLDEPTSSLDIAQQDIIFDLARIACSRNIGVLAIIHDLNQAVAYADDMLFLKGGEVVASGESSLVFTKANIEDTFGCPVNIYRLSERRHPFMVPDHDLKMEHPTLKVSKQSSNQ